MNRQVIRRSTLFYLNKPEKNENKGYIVAEVTLYMESDSLHLGIEQVSSSDQLDGLDSVYDMPTFNNVDLLKLSLPLAIFKSCEMHHEEDESVGGTLHNIRLNAAGLLTWKKKPAERFGSLDRLEMEEWHFHLRSAIKANAKFSGYKKLVAAHEMEKSALADRERAASRDKSAVDVNAEASYEGLDDVEEVRLQMEENDVYESSCPEGCFRATIIETLKSKNIGFSGNYFLRVGTDGLELLNEYDLTLIHSWLFKGIRKFGNSHGTFALEAGSACKGGPGTYKFQVVHVEELHESVIKAKQKLKVSPSVAPPVGPPPNITSFDQTGCSSPSLIVPAPPDLIPQPPTLPPQHHYAKIDINACNNMFRKHDPQSMRAKIPHLSLPSKDVNGNMDSEVIHYKVCHSKNSPILSPEMIGSYTNECYGIEDADHTAISGERRSYLHEQPPKSPTEFGIPQCVSPVTNPDELSSMLFMTRNKLRHVKKQLP